MNIGHFLPDTPVSDEEFIKIYNEFLIDLRFTFDRAQTFDEDHIPELIFSTSDNCRILKEWYEKLLKVGVSEYADDLKEACTKVTERLLGCFGALCHALKMLNGPNIEKYGAEAWSITEDFIREAQAAHKKVMESCYKV